MEAVEKDTSYSIGEALALLQKEFPDVSISKIRFLEAKGLIAPERTAAGFRRFCQADIDRLVAILKLQRDQYLPLAVIREQFTGESEEHRSGRKGRTGARARRDQPSLGLDGDDVPDEVMDPTREARSLRVVPDIEPEPAELPAQAFMFAQPPRAEPPSEPEPAETAPPTLSQESGLELLVASTATAFANVPLVPPQELARATSGTPGSEENPTPAEPEPVVAEETQAAEPKPRKGRKRPAQESANEPPSEAGEAVPGILMPREFIAQAGINAAFLAELEQYGIVKPTKVQGAVAYDSQLVELAKVAKSLDGLGLAPRHLKSLRVSVEKEFGLIEQLVATQLGTGGARGRRKAAETARALEEHSERFRRLLLSQLVSNLIGDQP